MPGDTSDGGVPVSAGEGCVPAAYGSRPRVTRSEEWCVGTPSASVRRGQFMIGAISVCCDSVKDRGSTANVVEGLEARVVYGLMCSPEAVEWRPFTGFRRKKAAE